MKFKYLILILIATAVIGSDVQAQGFINTVVSLTGSVFNQVTKLPETSTLLVMQNGKRITAARSRGSDNGSYYITGLKPGQTYDIQIQKKGFMKQVFSIQVPNTDKYAEISKDFQIIPMEVGMELPLEVSPFEYNKAKLRVGSEIFLEDLNETLKLNPDVKIQIVSYPDNNASQSTNETLTQKRAESLKDYFVDNGIVADRITLNPNKSTDPDNPPPTEKASKGHRYIGTSYLKIVSM